MNKITTGAVKPESQKKHTDVFPDRAKSIGDH